jgi:hypothetical protein
LVLILLMPACNLPQQTPSGDLRTPPPAGSPVPQISATPPGNPPASSTPLPTNTVIVPPTSDLLHPLVIKSSLCWEGPGPVYLVVSAVKNGERVELLGRGSPSGWWVIDNPIYHDPCWVTQDVLQIDPSFDSANLKIFYPPPTPTPTHPPTATPTP